MIGCSYDRALEDVAGKTGVAEAVQMIRAKVYATIAREWPELAEECRRQAEARGVVEIKGVFVPLIQDENGEGPTMPRPPADAPLIRRRARRVGVARGRLTRRWGRALSRLVRRPGACPGGWAASRDAARAGMPPSPRRTGPSHPPR